MLDVDGSIPSIPTIVFRISSSMNNGNEAILPYNRRKLGMYIV